MPSSAEHPVRPRGLCRLQEALRPRAGRAHRTGATRLADFAASWLLAAMLAAGPQSAAAKQILPSAASAPGAVVPWEKVVEADVLGDPQGQWASEARASTQYRPEDYSAKQATGAPDVPAYSDNKRAWSPSAAERQREWLELGFPKPVYATEVRVRQTLNPGAIVEVLAIEPNGQWHYLWLGQDPNRYAKDRIAWFVVRFPKTAYPVQRVKITLDAPAVKGWKQIDAVQLVGTPSPDPGSAAISSAVAPPTAAPPALLAAPAAANSATLPPGWRALSLYDEEKTFVAPRATTRVADGVRQLSSNIGDEKKFKGVTSPRILIDNPYLDPADPFFNIPRQMACLPDGGIVVFSTAKTHADGRMKGNPYATGAWRIAPDGAITAIGEARHILSENRRPFCGVPMGQSGLDPRNVGPVSSAPDGSLLFAYAPGWHFGRHAAVVRLTSDGRLAPVPEDIRWCAADPPEQLKKLFKWLGAVTQDPDGNVWVMDNGACTLYRIARDGSVSSVLEPRQVCPRGEPERHVLADHMVWDAARGELVTAGSLLWKKPPKADVYSSIWRIKPDGTFRRVYLAGKVGNGLPSIDGLTGLSLDAKGRIVFGAGIVHGSGSQILRLDEASGRTEVIAGAPSPTHVNHGDGPARQAHFRGIKGLCHAPDGTLFVHDATHVVRKITPAGQVTTWGF